MRSLATNHSSRFAETSRRRLNGERFWTRCRSILKGRAGFGVLRDRRAATAPVDAETVIAIVDVIAELWSGVHLCGIAILTRTAHDVPAQVAVALGDSRGIPLMAFDAEDAALSWLRELLQGAAREGRSVTR